MHIYDVITRRASGGSLSYDGVYLIKTTGVIANAVNTNGAGDIFVAASARLVSQFGPSIKAFEYGQIKQHFGISRCAVKRCKIF
jgi:sugar/nucleoside kinase (ribokinase family)